MYCVRKDPLLVLAAPHSDVRKGRCVSDPCAKLTVRYSARVPRGVAVYAVYLLYAREALGVDMVIRKNAETTEPKQSTHARGVCELCGGLGEHILSYI